MFKRKLKEKHYGQLGKSLETLINYPNIKNFEEYRLLVKRFLGRDGMDYYLKQLDYYRKKIFSE